MAGQCLRVGTCGFSYPEWIEAGIYPAGTKSGHMLDLYSRLFPVVELNYTWYQMARPEPLDRMLDRAPPFFRFTAKLTRTMTHEVNDQWKSHARLYCSGIRPLLCSGKLLAVLLQFPFSFSRTQTNRLYLSRLLDELRTLPLAVEFRHRSWATDRVFHALEQRNITLVTPDTPPLPELFPCLNFSTNTDFFYVRLHGRNSSGWGSATTRQRLSYRYSHDELVALIREVITPLRDCAGRGVIFFNNYVAGQAVDNARQMHDLLAGN